MSDHPSDLTEEEFKDYIEQVLINHYGEENVSREARLDSMRVPDFIVETELGTAMVEAKDDAEATIGGKGQVELYAAHQLSAFGVLLYPEGDKEEDLDYYGDAVCFMEYEYKPEEPESASLKMVDSEH